MEDLEEEFFVSSQRERENYLKVAHENHVSITFLLYDKETKIDHLKFNAYVFYESEPHKIETEFYIDQFEIKKLNDCFVMGFFFLNGVKIIFESDITSWKNLGHDQVCLSLESPNKMIRYQRRNAFRAKVPSNYGLKFDLDKNNQILKRLYVINISAGGAAILINADESFFEQNQIFENAYLIIPSPNNEVKLKTKICHRKKVQHEAIPSELKKIKTENEWYQVGIQFEQLPIKSEQMIVLLVNHLSKIL